MASTNSIKQPVIFLFGAGASVDAGIPDTYQFVRDFETQIRQVYPQLHATLLKIIEIRGGFNKRVLGSNRVDVEQLLDTLRRLIEKKNEPLLDFYEEKKFCSTLEESQFAELKTNLEDFIREKVIAKKEKLEYLKELLNFDTPLEIYSTNYDTCIEQLSYLNHRRYTDGFDVYWNEKNFAENYDIKHYKLHGSIIWYENTKTKECVKIPVHAFSEGKPVSLKLIYEEDVKPLLIYPAQKTDYIEPLTDLQLMFKQRLFSQDTKIVVIVGYSFRDNYIVHMLWDAARVNEDLLIIFISPNAREVFDNKLKFIEKDSPSRIQDRVICLSYPFCTVISELKNHYLRNLLKLCETEKENINNEKSQGFTNWRDTLQLAIDAEFLTKAETIIGKLGDNWAELGYGRLLDPNWLRYAIKGLLSSIIVNDEHENIWIKRINQMLERINADGLQLKNIQQSGFSIVFRFPSGGDGYYEIDTRDLINWIEPVFLRKRTKSSIIGSNTQDENGKG